MGPSCRMARVVSLTGAAGSSALVWKSLVQQKYPFPGGCVCMHALVASARCCKAAWSLVQPVRGLNQFGTEMANQWCTECGPWDSKC